MIYPDGRSVKWYHRPKAVKILLFFAVLIVNAVIFYIARSPEKIKDLSGGKFPKTFETTYQPLQKELEQLHRTGFFEEDESARNVPVVFTEWYSAPETRRILSGQAFESGEYRKLIRRSLKEGLKYKKLVFVDPLENPVPGDLFRTLLACFEQSLSGKDTERCLEMLDNLFCYTSLLLESNAPESYFAEKSMECGLLFEQCFAGNQDTLKKWNNLKRSFSGKYIFSMQKIYELERLRVMYDFEKIRQFGIRLFDGKPSGWNLIKEGLATVSFSKMKDGFFTVVTDHFYDVDRDQMMNFSMLKKLSDEGYTPFMLKIPDRKMSLRSYHRLYHDAEVLSLILGYIEKEQNKAEKNLNPE